METLRTIYKIGFGPSSSHTMGPQRAIEKYINEYKDLKSIEVTLFGSLAFTGKGHFTDYIIEKTVKEKSEIELSFKWDINELNIPHPNTMHIKGIDINNNKYIWEIISVGGGNFKILSRSDNIILNENNKENTNVYPHNTFLEICEYCYNNDMRLLEYINMYDKNLDDYLHQIWNVMKESIRRGIRTEGVLRGELMIERKAGKLYSENKNDKINLYAYAYAVNEENASASGIVVTAPTCGASGALPAVLKYYQDVYSVSDVEIINAIKIAGLIGTIVRNNATISGAVGGCQAEIGTATSMSAAAIAYLKGGNIKMIGAAAEIAMEHQLGLTCDPVLGYVQVPCIQRNAVAAEKAFTAYELASKLYEGEKVSFDTVVEVMFETGRDLASDYRETSTGGLAKLYKSKIIK